MSTLTLTPLPDLRLSHHYIPAHHNFPNTTPHARPLLIYHSAFPSTITPSTLEAHLKTNNLTPQWRYTMYPTSHYHSTTHEVLCIYSGRARLLFGGEKNPEKVEVDVGAGDAIVVPSGVAHRLLEDWGSGFMMVGSYPKGYAWDMCYGDGREEKDDMVEKVRGVKWLEKDPLYGDDGPVLWGRGRLERGGE